MVQGTMSGAGKSLLVTALCRIFRQDGFRVAPFKSQNMALNSFVTPDGLELGRAQAVQAEAAGQDCDVRMNPILLKPSSDMGSQLIVMGEVRGEYDAKTYFGMKRQLIPEILRAYHSLAEENDIIVIEGAGSPAEINLRQDDIVNMGLAELVDSPVLLAGDIDRGGVFAQLYGTIALLRPEERARVIGTVINKFRGDPALLQPGLQQLEELTAVPVLGVVPWLRVDIDDEDSLSPRFSGKRDVERPFDIAVVHLPHISNFTDFAPLEAHPAVSLRYVNRSDALGTPDLLILPGTKSTVADLSWLKSVGLAAAVLRLHTDGIPVLGICGGYQMLGRSIFDPDGVERQGLFEGLGLLPCETVFTQEKTRTRTCAVGVSAPFNGVQLEAYEIHMGQTKSQAAPFCRLADGRSDGAVDNGVFGTYLHGLFDSSALTHSLLKWLAERKGCSLTSEEPESRSIYRSRQYDLLADAVREALDLNRIRQAMGDYYDRASSSRRH